MTLPLARPFAPMEARTVDELPRDADGERWQYEPKWDGFRCLAFRDGDAVELQSKAKKPLTRYFPEVVRALRELGATRFVLDGELVVPVEERISFDDLLQRIHPAQSRIDRLAAERPALYVVFDLLVDARGTGLVALPLRERRARLDAFARQWLAGARGIALSPFTTDADEARAWLARSGAGLDGIVAKDRAASYRAGERGAMVKVKMQRTADCVIGGFRWSEADRAQVGSLLLGLYDEAGRLDHVGFTSGIPSRERAALTKRLVALQRRKGAPAGFTGRSPGGPSRWSSERSGEWEPLPHELVVEVSFDHFSGGRFRHGTRLVRWRPDKAPEQCTYEQILLAPRSSLTLLAGGGARRTSARAPARAEPARRARASGRRGTRSRRRR